MELEEEYASGEVIDVRDSKTCERGIEFVGNYLGLVSIMCGSHRREGCIP